MWIMLLLFFSLVVKWSLLLGKRVKQLLLPMLLFMVIGSRSLMGFGTRSAAADGPTGFASMATLYASGASESTGYSIGYGPTLGYSALADSALSFYGHLSMDTLYCTASRSEVNESTCTQVYLLQVRPFVSHIACIRPIGPICPF